MTHSAIRENEATDNELLMQFVRHRDESAMRQLIERHGTLIMGVCRQLARNEQDAEDAFQATLLILVTRAGRLHTVTSLGGWLHRVAYRTALRAGKRRAVRRERPLLEEPEMKQTDALQEIHRRDLQQILHEELQQLPHRYRDAIVLCDLEGNTRAQAADKLDCTEPAVKAALSRGRRNLRLRMLRRGVALSVAVLATKQSWAAASETAAARLASEATAACLSQLSTGAPAAGCSESIQILAREGVNRMLVSSMLRPAAIVSLAAVLVTAPLILMGQVSIGDDRANATTVIAASAADEPAAAVPISVPVTQLTQLAAAADIAPAPEPPSPRVKSLLDERLDVLRRLVATLTELHRSGNAGADSVMRAQIQLHDAELDAATSAEERRRIQAKRVQSFLELEKNLEVQRDQGTRSQAELLAVKAERLEAEIALEREKVEPGGIGPSPAAGGDESSSAGDAPAPIALHTYTLETGDILGVHIDGVLGTAGSPTLRRPSDPELPPAIGVPIPVQKGGLIDLPRGAPQVNVRGKTLRETAELIRRSYVDAEMLSLRPGGAIVTLIKRRTTAYQAALEAPIAIGDTLAIYVEGVLGDPNSDLPVVEYSDGILAVGLPFVVQSDGTVDLPFVGAVELRELPVSAARHALLRAYSVDHQILKPDTRSVIMLTVVKKHGG